MPRAPVLAAALLALALAITGCASLSSVPQGSAEVNFDPRIEGKTGWSRYEEAEFFPGVDLETAFVAGREGLMGAGFEIKRENRQFLTLIGEHGLTLVDWNVIAGVYFEQRRDGVAAKIVVQGSKDFGFFGDKTGDNWTKRILMGMRVYILESSRNK